MPDVNAGMAVRVDLDRAKQTIDGFGVCEAFRQAGHIRKLPGAAREEVLDLLFSVRTGAGFSIIRNIVGDGGSWGDRLDGPTPTIEPAEGVWNWTGDDDQIWLTREALSRGCGKVIASVWSPPAWMKSNGVVTNGGSLREDKREAFAEYLSRYVREYRSRHGIEICAISPTNEPDMNAPYSSCLWTGPQLAEFIADCLGPAFDRDRVEAKTIMPETEHFGLARAGYFEPALEDPRSASFVGVIAQHGYGGKIEDLGAARDAGKPVWLTEISDARKDSNDPSIRDGIRWARSVHDYLTIAGVSAYCYFWGASIYHRGPISLLGMVADEGRIVRNKRLFAIGNYARFVRPGFHRVEATPKEADGPLVSVFADEGSGQVVAVAINEQETSRALRLRIEGATGTRFECWRTSATEDLARAPSVRAADGILATVLAGLSVTSFIGTVKRARHQGGHAPARAAR